MEMEVIAGILRRPHDSWLHVIDQMSPPPRTFSLSLFLRTPHAIIRFGQHSSHEIWRLGCTGSPCGISMKLVRDARSSGWTTRQFHLHLIGQRLLRRRPSRARPFRIECEERDVCGAPFAKKTRQRHIVWGEVILLLTFCRRLVQLLEWSHQIWSIPKRPTITALNPRFFIVITFNQTITQSEMNSWKLVVLFQGVAVFAFTLENMLNLALPHLRVRATTSSLGLYSAALTTNSSTTVPLAQAALTSVPPTSGIR